MEHVSGLDRGLTGSICDAFYGLPSPEIINEVYKRMPKQMAKVVTAFVHKYIDEKLTLPEGKGDEGTLEEKLKRIFN